MKKELQKLLKEIESFGIKLNKIEKEYIYNSLAIAYLKGGKAEIVDSLKHLKKKI